jgi:hypothetical protein
MGNIYLASVLGLISKTHLFSETNKPRLKKNELSILAFHYFKPITYYPLPITYYRFTSNEGHTLCKGYEIRQSEDVIIVKTPIRYDDGDHVVVFITPQQNNEFLIDDNGEAATRLMFEGVDLDSQLIQIWLKNTQAIYHLEWDAERDALWCKAPVEALIERIICITQVSAQLQTLTAVVLNSEEQIEELLEQLLQYKQLLSEILSKQTDKEDFEIKIGNWELGIGSRELGIENQDYRLKDAQA